MKRYSFFESDEPMQFTVPETVNKQLAAIGEELQSFSISKAMVYCLDRICTAALERNTNTQFIDELADTMKDAFFGEDNVPQEYAPMIKRMKNIAHERQQQREAQAHARELERQRASAPVISNSPNYYGEHSITNDGQANIGGGTIAMGGAV